MEKDAYICSIKADEVGNVYDLKIDLNCSSRQHLILTGKNGVGKTTLLRAINVFLEKVFNGSYSIYDQKKVDAVSYKDEMLKIRNGTSPGGESKLRQLENNLREIDRWFERFGEVELTFSDSSVISDMSLKGNFVIAFFDSKRTSSDMLSPEGGKEVKLNKRSSPSDRAGQRFIQYLSYLKIEQALYNDTGDRVRAKQIERWFLALQDNLREVLDEPSMQLEFDIPSRNFYVVVEGKKKYKLTELSDGYSSILSIVSEILMRMEAWGADHSRQGIVMIDELEAHLHVSLQKNIFPFLIGFFPNIQFVITTHSPFVLSSVRNAVICDLQNKIITEDLSRYSYSVLVESYFGVSKYSDKLWSELNRLEEIINSNQVVDVVSTIDDIDRLLDFPKYLSKDLYIKISQLKDKLVDSE